MNILFTRRFGFVQLEAMERSKPPLRIKIISMGNAEVGKVSIVVNGNELFSSFLSIILA